MQLTISYVAFALRFKSFFCCCVGNDLEVVKTLSRYFLKLVREVNKVANLYHLYSRGLGSGKVVVVVEFGQ